MLDRYGVPMVQDRLASLSRSEGTHDDSASAYSSSRLRTSIPPDWVFVSPEAGQPLARPNSETQFQASSSLSPPPSLSSSTSSANEPQTPYLITRGLINHVSLPPPSSVVGLASQSRPTLSEAFENYSYFTGVKDEHDTGIVVKDLCSESTASLTNISFHVRPGNNQHLDFEARLIEIFRCLQIGGAVNLLAVPCPDFHKVFDSLGRAGFPDVNVEVDEPTISYKISAVKQATPTPTHWEALQHGEEAADSVARGRFIGHAIQTLRYNPGFLPGLRKSMSNDLNLEICFEAELFRALLKEAAVYAVANLRRYLNNTTIVNNIDLRWLVDGGEIPPDDQSTLEHIALGQALLECAGGQNNGLHVLPICDIEKVRTLCRISNASYAVPTYDEGLGKSWHRLCISKEKFDNDFWMTVFLGNGAEELEADPLFDGYRMIKVGEEVLTWLQIMFKEAKWAETWSVVEV